MIRTAYLEMTKPYVRFEANQKCLFRFFVDNT